MLFVIWFVAWVFTVGTIGGLVLPMLALMTRSSYLDRPVLPNATTVGIGVIVYLFAELSLTTTHALVIGARSALVYHFLRHIVVMASRSATGSALMPLRPAQFYVIVVRGVRLLSELVLDVSYAAKVRRLVGRTRPGASGLLAFMWADIRTLAMILLEVVAVERGFNDAIVARGHFANPKLWKDRGAIQDYMYVGDISLLATMCFAVSSAGEHFTPSWIQKVTHAVEAHIPMAKAGPHG